MINKGRRETGRAYRRCMARHHRDARMRIILRKKYDPRAGYVDWAWVDGIWQPVGRYIKYPKNSRQQGYWKRHSNKIVRRSADLCQGNLYRKYFEYTWTLF